MSDSEAAPTNFIRQRVAADLSGARVSEVVTRFPPEPNGYLHIGHAKSICLNFGIADDFDGRCFLRFDDTNPEKEEMEFVESIQRDVRWLGFNWQDRLTHASDYFERLYEFAMELVLNSNAYVCSLSAEEIRESRGTLTEPGKESPFRNRSVEENIDLFNRMREGEFADGEHVLRARIDMTSGNLNMRDPVLYRIRHQVHQITGDRWCIYPLYDFTHCISDAIEGVTHSLCTLEFEDHRPLYDWVLDNTSVSCHPQQIEFSRLALDYTVMSKRMLTQLVRENHVSTWDDPRMPTIAGLRRRGYTPASIRLFCERIGVTKKDNRIEMSLLENCVREDLESSAPRRMAVIDPLKVVINNYPEDLEETFSAANHPADAGFGTREVPFAKEIYIERSDFMIDPPRKFFRLGPGREVRLRYAYLVTCTGYDTDDNGDVTTVYCDYDNQSHGGNAPDGRKVKGTIHWVSAKHAIPAEVRLYDRLFMRENPVESKQHHFSEFINPDSLITVTNAMLEPALASAENESRFQFERLGYFCVDEDSTAGQPVFNRTVTLRDSWAKQRGQGS
ncbi:MAG: glutamine--tRNA ligase [marine bacterium B5-7]|nr:MAG: glutamine--tRNA ligase [marine bacterium B5-7]